MNGTGSGSRWRRGLELGTVALVFAGSASAQCVGVLRADQKDELPSRPDDVFCGAPLPWLDPDRPIANSALGRLLFYQYRQVPDPIRMRRLDDTVEVTVLLPPRASVVGTSCLPLDAGQPTQDIWYLEALELDTPVSLTVDVLAGNDTCPAQPAARCATPPDPLRGPLDPKLAVYPPGAIPRAPPFAGLRAVDCDIVLTGDVGCLGAPRDPGQDCIVCDNLACTLPGAPAGSCARLAVILAVPGVWLIAVAAQPPAIVAESEGCYRLSVQALGGRVVGGFGLRVDDGPLTF